jgi:hypothetical protein
LGIFVQAYREGATKWSEVVVAPVVFISTQGNSLDVTGVSVMHAHELGQYAWAYLLYELQDAFVPRDVSSYIPGTRLSDDITVLLKQRALRLGIGTGGSYLAEMYLMGGLGAVVIVSFVLGTGLHLLYRVSMNAIGLFIVACILPTVILMPRGQILDWVSVLALTGVSLVVLWCGWLAYDFVLSGL